MEDIHIKCVYKMHRLENIYF